jgi:uncharacterized protein (TIGR02118 family)
MIRLLQLLVRRDGLTRAEFDRRWFDDTPHLLIAAPGCRRYVQYRFRPERFQTTGPMLLDLELDGIEEIWLEGSRENAAKAASDLWTRTLGKHYASFVGGLSLLEFEESEIVNRLTPGDLGLGLLKRLVPLVRKEGSTHAEFLDHWIRVHAPLLKQVIPGPRRYHQLYVRAQLFVPEGPPQLDCQIDGFSESWFRDETEMNAAVQTPEGKALAADNSLYLSKSRRFFFDEIEYTCPISA